MVALLHTRLYYTVLRLYGLSAFCMFDVPLENQGHYLGNGFSHSKLYSDGFVCIFCEIVQSVSRKVKAVLINPRILGFKQPFTE